MSDHKTPESISDEDLENAQGGLLFDTLTKNGTIPDSKAEPRDGGRIFGMETGFGSVKKT